MTHTTYSPKEMQSRFIALLEEEKELSILPQGDSNKYYQAQEKFTSNLRIFIRADFSSLSSRQLLKLCSLISAYRPVEPFSFLVTCSNLID